MSKIGKLPIAIPAGVTVTVAPGLVTVKGAKGELKQAVNDRVTVEVKGNEVIVTSFCERRLFTWQKRLRFRSERESRISLRIIRAR